MVPILVKTLLSGLRSISKEATLTSPVVVKSSRTSPLSFVAVKERRFSGRGGPVPVVSREVIDIGAIVSCMVLAVGVTLDVTMALSVWETKVSVAGRLDSVGVV